MSSLFKAFVSLLLVSLFTTSAYAQSQLENPTNGSNQSGQGVIFGWVCNASVIELVVDGSLRVQAPYGTLRTDTQGTCGDANNGFGFQVNWNALGDGGHTLVVFADGTQIAQATFTVQTLGVPYLTGASGNYQLDNFAEKNVTITWSEPLQNFVITGWSPSSGGPPPPGSSSLQDLLGRWAFTYIIVSTFTDHFLLPSVTVANGIPAILGTDLDLGGAIIAARTADLSSTSIPFEFALLDPDSAICDFFVFNKTGANTVSGQYFLASKDAAGNCDELLSDTPRSMTGLRTSVLTSLQFVPFSPMVDAQKTHEEKLVQSRVLDGIEEEPQIDPELLKELVRQIQRQ